MADEATPRAPGYNGANDTYARIQRDKLKRALNNVKRERDEDRKRVEKLEADLAEARKAESAVEELAALKARVKLDMHRGKFNELARAAGAKEKALDDLWEKSGYNMPGEVPDEGAIKAAIARQQVDRDYLFEPPGENGQGSLEEGASTEPEAAFEQPRPGPARGQGGTRRSTGGATQITDAQMRDPLWCFANQAKIAAAAREVADLPISQVGSKFTIV